MEHLEQTGMPKVEKKRSQLFVWDITSFNVVGSGTDLAQHLRKLGKHWVFQLEESKEKKHHWQIRISLHKKTDLAGLKKLLCGGLLEGAHLSQTVAGNTRNFDYVMKEQSRVDGPWTDQDANPNDFEPIVMSSPLNEFQKEQVEWIDGPIHPRKIRVVVDTIGGIGKGHLKDWLQWKKKATIIPPFTKMEDIMGFVLNFPPSRCYVIDLPRGLNPRKLQDFWSGVESLKDGNAYDKRYKPRTIKMRKPHILVLCNWAPELGHLSKDRWDIIIPHGQQEGAKPPPSGGPPDQAMTYDWETFWAKTQPYVII